MIHPDEKLRQQLRAWQPQTALPVRFQADVWARIEAQSATRRRSWVRQLVPWLLAALAQPRYAAAVIVLAVALGLGLASVSAQASQAERSRELEVRYVRSVNPYLQLVAPRP